MLPFVRGTITIAAANGATLRPASLAGALARMLNEGQARRCAETADATVTFDGNDQLDYTYVDWLADPFYLVTTGEVRIDRNEREFILCYRLSFRRFMWLSLGFAALAAGVALFIFAPWRRPTIAIAVLLGFWFVNGGLSGTIAWLRSRRYLTRSVRALIAR